MSTKQIMRTMVYCGYLLIYNLIFFFIMGNQNSASDWIAYVFVWIAIIISYVAPLYCKNYKRIPENLVTNYTYSWIYSTVTILFNAMVILIRITNLPVVLSVNLIFCVVYMQQLFISLRVNYHVETNLERTDSEREFVRGISRELQMCRDLVNDTGLKDEIEKAYDAVRCCPIRSNDVVMNYELEIIELTKTLEKKIDNNELQEIKEIVSKIINLVNKRNALL